MQLTRQQKRAIKEFRFRVATHIEGSIYRILPAKEMFANPLPPHVLTDDRVAFWHDGCCDHACCLNVKDILFD